MKTLKYKLDKTLYIPEYISSDETVCFLDIETDGLSHSYNKVILVGLFMIDLKSNSQFIVQVFSEKSDEELFLLDSLNKLLLEVDTVFTYNGASFDFPFLKKRFEKHKLDHSLDSLAHVDIMRKIKKNKEKLSLPDCKLKTVEKIVGVERTDTINGRESVLLYKEYLKSKSPAIEKTILKHNYEDIYYLPDVLKVEKLINFQNSIALSIGDKKVLLELDPRQLKVSNSSLKVSIETPHLKVPDYIVFEDVYSLNWDTFSGKLNMEFFTESALDENHLEIKFIDISDLSIDKLSSGLSDMVPICIGNDMQYSNAFSLIEAIIRKHI